MLEVFQALAIRLRWLRPVIAFVTALFAALFVYAAAASDAPDSYFTAGVTGVAWGLLLFTFLEIFPGVPQLPTEAHSGWQRFKIRLRRIGYGVLMFGVLALTLVTASLTAKLLNTLPH